MYWQWDYQVVGFQKTECVGQACAWEMSPLQCFAINTLTIRKEMGNKQTYIHTYTCSYLSFSS